MVLEALRLDGPPRRVAIITGGSRGLGKAMATALALAGAEVVLASRTKSQLEAAAAEIRSASGREPLIVPTNVQSSAECDALVTQTLERFGRLDIMLNNAGIGDSRGAGARIWDLSDADWQDGIEVNLHSTFYCSRAAARGPATSPAGSAPPAPPDPRQRAPRSPTPLPADAPPPRAEHHRSDPRSPPPSRARAAQERARTDQRP